MLVLRSFCVIPAVLLSLFACSPDRPAPIAPAGKRSAVQDAPAAPENLRVEALTDSSARVAWDAVDGATDYDVNYRIAQGGRWTNWPHRGASKTYSIIRGLEPDTEYRWAARAENRDGPSAWVFAENFTTLSAPAEPFNIELYWEISYPPPFIQAVEEAAARWETIITEGLEDSNAEHLSTYPDKPSSLQDIDDLAIVVRVNQTPGADREGNAYGAASIGLRRTAEYYTRDIGLPIYGTIYLPDKPEYREGYRNNEYVKFYSDELNFLAIHEIGHVLGLAYSFPVQDVNGFSRAYSPKALEVWQQHVPQQYHQGRNYVPIHSGHWSYQYPASDYAKMWIITNSTMSIFRLSQFDVFGHYRAYDNPGGDTYYTDKIITELDVAALDDMGYTVDMDQAEPLMVKMKSAASYGFGKANTYSQIICEGIH